MNDKEPTKLDDIDFKLFRAIANHRNYQQKRTVGEKNEDMRYESLQPKSIALVRRIKDIYSTLLEQSEKKAKRELLDNLVNVGEIHHSVYDYRIEEAESI